MRAHTISPQTYAPSTKLNQNRRYLDIGIGLGIGQKFSKKSPQLKFPGVGDYNLPSIFDKTRRTKYPLN